MTEGGLEPVCDEAGIVLFSMVPELLQYGLKKKKKTKGKTPYIAESSLFLFQPTERGSLR